jgi:hypothetical protein
MKWMGQEHLLQHVHSINVVNIGTLTIKVLPTSVRGPVQEEKLLAIPSPMVIIERIFMVFFLIGGDN